MFPKFFLIALAVLTLVSLACGVTVNLPVETDIKTGPTVTDEISIERLDDPELTADLTLSFGAGELFLAPGASAALVEGTATYNVADLKPIITQDGSVIELRSGDLQIDGFPEFKGELENKWDLRLGSDPLDLTIKAGAYSADLDLGGLAIEDLRVTDGAADVTLDFSLPNTIPMHSLRYETGASNIRLKNLGNASFQSLDFKAGAGNYELDFTGAFTQDATATLDIGLSSLTITVPEGLDVRVSLTGSLTNVSTRGGWTQSGTIYTVSGDGPSLDITIRMGAGNLILIAP